MVFRARRGLVIVAVAMVAVACNSSDSSDTTTSTADVPLTTLASSGSTGTADESTTTTTAAPKTILTAPEYRIVDRIEGDGPGDTVIVLLDPATYDSLSTLDLYDLIAEVVELFPPVAILHVVDNAAAANVVANPDASEAERQSAAGNYLARLENGFQITYLGPFASSGTAVLGS
jgi:hypothetical protein